MKRFAHFRQQLVLLALLLGATNAFAQVSPPR
jgi:hypothetical protein